MKRYVRLDDWVPIPLAYTQVVNIAVRAYFLVALLGRQYLIHENDTPNAKSIDLFVPIMSILQFLFYIGWTKVAEVLLNPLGMDDDDASLTYMFNTVLFSLNATGYLTEISRSDFLLSMIVADAFLNLNATYSGQIFYLSLCIRRKQHIDETIQ